MQYNAQGYMLQKEKSSRISEKRDVLKQTNKKVPFNIFTLSGFFIAMTKQN